jgi:hypothetical protein
MAQKSVNCKLKHVRNIFFFHLRWGETVHGTSANIWPIVPTPDDGWWLVWSSRWDTWQEKPAPVPLCIPQIPDDRDSVSNSCRRGGS